LGNEPCFGSAYVYNYLGKAWKSQRLVRQIINRFNNTPNGLPGDDDAGAMSALYVFSAIGLYPYIPGIGGFIITGPLFEKVEIKFANRKNITLTAQNACTANPYIRQITVNGKPYRSTWIELKQLKNGIPLHFVMDNEPQVHWGSRPADAPPSFY
jgi:hypothetical protein